MHSVLYSKNVIKGVLIRAGGILENQEGTQKYTHPKVHMYLMFFKTLVLKFSFSTKISKLEFKKTCDTCVLLGA